METTKELIVKSRTFKPTIIPSWGLQLIDFGKWMYADQREDRRLILFLLAPSRHCLSSFVALGSMMASLVTHKDISKEKIWNTVKEMETGEKIYLLYKHKGHQTCVSGILSPIDFECGQECRKIKLNSRKKEINGTILSVFLNNIDDYHISLTPHSSQHRMGKLSKTYSFYKKLLGDCENGWLDTDNNLTVLATNIAEWHRDVDDIEFAIKADIPEDLIFFKLKDLLGLSGTDGSNLHTLITSPKTCVDSAISSLTILDGLDGLQELANVDSKNIVVILSQSEYDDECEHLIKQFSRYRQKSLTPDLPDHLKNTVSEIEAMIIAIPEAT